MRRRPFYHLLMAWLIQHQGLCTPVVNQTQSNNLFSITKAVELYQTKNKKEINFNFSISDTTGSKSILRQLNLKVPVLA